MVSNSDHCKLEQFNEVELEGLSHPTSGPTYEYRASKGKPNTPWFKCKFMQYISSDYDTYQSIEIWMSTITNMMDWRNSTCRP